jgi:predicted NBD/HSP70 family sugar kinase
MQHVTADQTTVRHANLGVVLRHVRDRAVISRARIAAETGLNKSTVSSLIAELIDLGLVRETGDDERPGSVGRPAATVCLSTTMVAIGLELNVDYIAVALEDLAGNAIAERRIYRDLRESPPGPVLDELARLATAELELARTEGLRVFGIGIAVPGLVDVGPGVLLRAPNLGWQGVAIARELAERLDMPELVVRVENEANLAALSELWHGGARNRRSFVYVFGEIGVGAGIVIDSVLFRGAHGFSGEFGHVTIDRSGAPCACGSRGCLETIAGLEAIAIRAGLVPGSIDRTQSLAEELGRRAAGGDAATLASLDQAAAALGPALASAINLLDLDAVVLGGCYEALAPWLIKPIELALEQRVLSSEWTRCDVEASSVAGAPVRGAAAIVLRQVFEQPRLAVTPAGV